MVAIVPGTSPTKTRLADGTVVSGTTATPRTNPYAVRGDQRSFNPTGQKVTGYGLFKRTTPSAGPGTSAGAIGSTLIQAESALDAQRRKDEAIAAAKEKARQEAAVAAAGSTGAIGSTVNAVDFATDTPTSPSKQPATSTLGVSRTSPIATTPASKYPPAEITAPVPPQTPTTPTGLRMSEPTTVNAAPPASQPVLAPTGPSLPPSLTVGTPTSGFSTMSTPAPSSIQSMSLKDLMGGGLTTPTGSMAATQPTTSGVTGMGSLAPPSSSAGTVANPGNLGTQQATTPQQASLLGDLVGDDKVGAIAGVVEGAREQAGGGTPEEVAAATQEAAAGAEQGELSDQLLGGVDGSALGGLVADFISQYESNAGTPDANIQGMLAELLGQAGFDPASLMGEVNANWMSAMDPGAWEEMARNRLASANEANLSGLNEAERRINARAARTGLQNTGGQRSSVYNSFRDTGVQAERDIFNDALTNQMNAMQGASSFGLGQNSQDIQRWAQMLGIGAEGAGAQFNAIRQDNPSGASVFRDIVGGKAAQDAANTQALGAAGGGLLGSLGGLASLLGLGA